MTECNVDDILCQIEVLRNLRGLQAALGEKKFTDDFPELVGIDERLALKIEAKKGDIRQSLSNRHRWLF